MMKAVVQGRTRRTCLWRVPGIQDTSLCRCLMDVIHGLSMVLPLIIWRDHYHSLTASLFLWVLLSWSTDNNDDIRGVLLWCSFRRACCDCCRWVGGGSRRILGPTAIAILCSESWQQLFLHPSGWHHHTCKSSFSMQFCNFHFSLHSCVSMMPACMLPI